MLVLENMFQLSQWIEIEEFHYKKNDVITPHSCLWGDFNFSLNGLLEFSINGKIYLSPPSYGIWIPPQTEHCSIALDQHVTHYICIRLHPQLCDQFSIRCQTLTVQPFLRQTVHEILTHQKSSQYSEHYHQHLLQILLDQLTFAPCYDQYLPQSHHPVLEPILKKLADSTRFSATLQQILAEFELSERHILRLSQRELSMSISEWRNRSKIVYAIMQLHHGQSIKKISLELGYKQSSSFIEFFKRYTGQTPTQLLER